MGEKKMRLKLIMKFISYKTCRETLTRTLFMIITSTFCKEYYSKINKFKKYWENSLFTYVIFDNRKVSVVNLHIYVSISLGGNFEENVRRQCLTLCEEMRNELRRLMSFARISVGVSCIRLAAAGFFATGVGDETMCFSCGIMIKEWQWGNDPVAVHRRVSPHCPHANGHDHRNVPAVPFRWPLPFIMPSQDRPHIGTASTTTDATEVESTNTNEATSEATVVSPQDELPENLVSPEIRSRLRLQDIRQVVRETQVSTHSINEPHPLASNQGPNYIPIHNALPNRSRYPNYNDSRDRLNSFKDWPQVHCVKTEALAKAGFFYTGNGDCVRCFYCGVGLRTWEREDDPWVEHVRWRSSCDYVRLVRGEEFVEETLQNFALTEEMEQKENPPETKQEAAGRKTDSDAETEKYEEAATLTEEFEVMEGVGLLQEQGEAEKEGARGYSD